MSPAWRLQILIRPARIVLIGTAAILVLCTAVAARGDDAETDARIKKLEDRVKQVDALEQRLHQTEAKVTTLQEKLATYENAPPATSAAEAAANQHAREETIAQIDAASQAYGDGKHDFDLHFWGWLGFWDDPHHDGRVWWNGEFQLGATKTFSDRLAVSTDVNVIDAYDQTKVELEQIFMSYLISPKNQTLLTFGKFNAPFGIEPRDIWFRLNSTPSPIFQAQPHDLTGVMLSQPLGATGLTLRPFVVNGIESNLGANLYPSAGLTVEFQPIENLTFSATGWGEPRYPGGDGNPFFLGETQVTWKLPPHLTLSAEALYGLRQTAAQRQTWSGLLALANYDLTDRWRVFSLWSYVNDPQSQVLYDARRQQELAAGAAYQLFHDVELRAEYRHDFVNTSEGEDTVSLDLTFGF